MIFNNTCTYVFSRLPTRELKGTRLYVLLTAMNFPNMELKSVLPIMHLHTALDCSWLEG